MQLTIKQAAELLHASESQVRKWIRDRGLPAVVFNEQYRLNRIDLLAWAQDNQIPVPDEVREQAPRPGESPLADALERGGIHRDIPGDTRDAVLRAVVSQLALPPAVDRELLLEMIVAREARGSTALGHGIAIPHARYPLVSAVPEPILGLAFLRQPVDFAALDGEKVFAVFTLIAPTTRAHLQLLARLARTLSGALAAPIQARAADDVIVAAVRASERPA